VNKSNETSCVQCRSADLKAAQAKLWLNELIAAVPAQTIIMLLGCKGPFLHHLHHAQPDPVLMIVFKHIINQWWSASFYVERPAADLRKRREVASAEADRLAKDRRLLYFDVSSCGGEVQGAWCGPQQLFIIALQLYHQLVGKYQSVRYASSSCLFFFFLELFSWVIPLPQRVSDTCSFQPSSTHIHTTSQLPRH
jgi:hypothetical protein